MQSVVPPRHVPTIDDLRVKLCYICREEERADDAPTDHNTIALDPIDSNTAAVPPETKRLWIHPCNCTLVAHESCLLQWIETSQQDSSRAQNALKCPQCGAAYEIESDRPPILGVFQVVERIIAGMGKVVAVGSVAVLVTSFGAGLYVVCTAYGAYAVRQFLGSEVHELLLTDDPVNWPWHAWIDLPLIPLVLILARTPLVTGGVHALPFILSWPLSPLASPSASSVQPPMRLLLPGEYPFPHPLRSLLFSWPPSPALLAFLYPTMRLFYQVFWQRITKYVLRDEVAQQHGGPHRIVWGREDNGIGELQIRINNDAEPAPRPPQGANGGGAREQAERDQLAEEQQQMRLERGQAAGAGEAVERTTRITTASLGRLIGGSLILPAVANIMGSLLFRLSIRSPLLRRILAVRPPLNGRVPYGWSFDSLKTKGPTSFTRSVLLGLNIGLGLWSGSNVWQTCDPVWWRNSLGLGLFFLAKDSIHLLHLWLSKKELESRRVKSRSFEGVDTSTLDLINSDVTTRVDLAA